MNVRFLIYKNKGSDGLHARFILNKADRIYGIDITAALCMENKKSGWIHIKNSLRRLFDFVFLLKLNKILLQLWNINFAP